MTEQNTDNIVQPTQKPQTPHPKKRRWLTYTAIGSIILLSGLTAGGYWLANTQNGLAFAIHQLPKLANINIQTETLQGTLLQGFQGENIRIETPSADLTISSLTLHWQAQELWQHHLHINRLAAGDIRIKSKPTPPEPDKQPAKLPETISLPFTAAIDHLQIGSISTVANKKNEPDNEILHSIQASYHYNHQQHLLNIQSLHTSWSNSQGTISLDTILPFTLKGELNSTGTLDDIAIKNQLQLSGSLKDIQINTLLSGNGIGLTGDTTLHPFAPKITEKIERIVLNGHNINPHAFQPNLPQADLTFNIAMLPHTNDKQMALTGTIDVKNNRPLPADDHGIPLRQLTGKWGVSDAGTVSIESMQTQLMQQGQLNLNGTIDTQAQKLNLTATLNNITATDIRSQKLDGKLNGTIRAENSFAEPLLKWQLNTGRADVSGSLNIATDKTQGQRTLWIKEAQVLPQNGGKLRLSGSYELFQEQKLTAKINSENFNPNRLYPSLPTGSVNGKINLDGLIAKQQFGAQITFSPSQLSGVSLSGNGKIEYKDNHLSRADTDIHLGPNHLFTQGSFGKKGNTLSLDINAPELNRFGFGVQGTLIAKGTLTSIEDGFTKLDAKLNGSARQLVINDAIKAQNLDFTFIGSPERNRPLDITLKGNSINASGTTIDNINVALKGTLSRHQLQAESSLKINNKPLTLNAHADGGLNEKNQWLGQISTLNVGGALDLKLQNRMNLEAGTERVRLSAARWQAFSGSLNLERFSWDKRTGLSTQGHANNLHLAQLHNFYQPPIDHNLVLSGDWDLTYSQNPNGYLSIRQQSGDITLNDARKTPLLLSQFVLNTQLNARGILSKFSGNTRYGKAEGNFDILQTFGGNHFSQAPISGRVMVHSENLNNLKNYLPIGQSINGTLYGDIQINGRLNTPQFSGSITGQNLNYINRDIGIMLNNGTLKSRLAGQRWIVEALTFHRKNGTITLAGSAGYTDDAPDVDAKVTFNHYQILDKPNRRLTLSGVSDVIYTKDGMTLTGTLKTDEGRFGFQDNSAPQLDDDVLILGKNPKEPSKPLPFNLNLVFDLNDKFNFSGQGLNVTLGGKLTLTAKPGSNVQAIGSIQVINGRYKAYGQDLVIKKGIISFIGPLDQPNLNIRAERRSSPVGAGVEVLGNLETPRVTLVANEPMSEKDKLSWLILNRASSGSSTDEAALATAAGAFLAGSLNDKIGLVDDFGLTSQQTRNAQTGEMNPAQQVLTFGKQLTRDLYLGYEVGLQTASQSVKLVYQLSRSFQVIGRTGTISSGGEIKYIKRFD